jgi:serine/threonine protein kinase/tetratricopeptide (TPR) repeat protein
MPASLPPGARLGGYRIVESLGSGGMGEVYLAHDVRLDRKVAIKIVAAEVAGDADRLRRFVREAKTASSLNHPSIAHVYEIGEADGVHFLVMEYVRGVSLDRRIGTRGLPPPEAIIVATQIADALDEAHGHGVVHRDLKPANVMITSRNRVKVLDFGLAKLLPQSDAADSRFSTDLAGTSAGLVLGTLDYMSPEQVRGLEVDLRSDIFSFGVLLYQMLTGRLPFASTSRTDTIYRITQAQPEAISRFVYDVPPDLERIVRKCLEKDPARRYQSAQELLVDLTHLRSDGSGVSLPIAAPPPPGPAYRYWVAGLLVVAAAAALGAGGAVWTMRERLDVIDSIAVVPRVDASAPREAGDLARGIAKALVNSLTQLPNVSVTPREMAFVAGSHAEDPYTIAEQLGVHAVLLIRVEPGVEAAALDLQLVDAAHRRQVWGHEYARSLSEIEAARESISDEVWNALRLRLNTENRRAVEALQLYQRGRYLAARRKEPDLRSAIDLYEQALQLDRELALAHAGKAEALNLLAVYGFSRPHEAFPQAKAAAERALQIDERLADAHTTLAWVNFRWDWAFESAGRRFARALALAPEDAQTQYWAGLFETAMGRFDEALGRIDRAQKLDPVSVAFRDLAWALFMARRPDEAMAAALDASRAAPQSFLPYRTLGLAHTALGDFERAIAAYQTAIRLEGGDSALLNGELAYVYARAGRGEDARRHLTDLFGRRSRGVYVSPYGVGLTYAAAGDRTQAFEWLEIAYRERDNMLVWMKVDPRLDPVREDPRFAELLGRMKFE